MTDIALCRLEDIPSGRAIGRELTSGARHLSVIVLRHEDTVTVYLNSCPHVGVRLEWRPDDFLDITDDFLQCSTHGALFEKERGRCLAGPCRGAALVPVAIRVDREGTVWAIDPEALPPRAGFGKL